VSCLLGIFLSHLLSLIYLEIMQAASSTTLTCPNRVCLSHTIFRHQVVQGPISLWVTLQDSMASIHIQS
jgi:hypothetical protein